MKKVLIVEDEILARLGIRQLLRWEELGYALLEDAKDGQEAIQSIEAEHPEIILLDLNIPKVNGIEILQYLRMKKYECKVIIISCNEEFEVVKKAMQLGAYDYLRKMNLSAEELLGILQRDDFNLIKGKGVECTFQEVRFEEVVGGRNIFIHSSIFRTVICILNQSLNKLFETVSVTQSCLKEFQLSYIQINKGADSVYYILEKDINDIEAKEIFDRLTNYLGNHIYIGICKKNIYSNEELCDAIVLAEQVTILSYYDDQKKLYFIDQFIESSEHGPNGIYEKEAELKIAISKFKLDKTLEKISEIFVLIRRQGYTKQNVLRRIFMDMLGMYSMTAVQLGSTIEEIEIDGDNCHYQKIMMLNSLNAIEKWFLDFTKIFYNHNYILYKCKESDIVQKTVDYVGEHLYEAISLSETAKYVGVSGAYLSTVFKKEIGQNFVDYINRQKIIEAQKLLNQGQLVYEISEKLGFENVTYFSRVFKKYSGISAEQWKKTR